MKQLTIGCAVNFERIMMFKRLFAVAVTGLALMAASAVHALPSYVAGSFAFAGGTTTTTDVTTTTTFVLTGPTIFTTASFGDMTNVLPFTFLTLGAGAANFLVPATFNWSDPGVGSFVATSASLLGTVGGANASATWDVVGTFTVGALWTNPGTVLSANSTWVMSQTGGPGSAISIGGTFNSPRRQVSEPAILALMGLGLAGLGLVRRRKQSS